MPPISVNEDGRRAQTQPCSRPGCGREVPLRRYRYDTPSQIGWPLFGVARFTNWCGNGQELIRCRMIASLLDSYRSSARRNSAFRRESLVSPGYEASYESRGSEESAPDTSRSDAQGVRRQQ